jgi:hypothetical protein
MTKHDHYQVEVGLSSYTSWEGSGLVMGPAAAGTTLALAHGGRDRTVAEQSLSNKEFPFMIHSLSHVPPLFLADAHSHRMLGCCLEDSEDHHPTGQPENF